VKMIKVRSDIMKVERFDPKPLTWERTFQSGLGSSRSTYQCLCFTSENLLYCMDTADANELACDSSSPRFRQLDPILPAAGIGGTALVAKCAVGDRRRLVEHVVDAGAHADAAQHFVAGVAIEPVANVDVVGNGGLDLEDV